MPRPGNISSPAECVKYDVDAGFAGHDGVTPIALRTMAGFE
jgi:hypothetical protein